jgi:hypothetical protein
MCPLALSAVGGRGTVHSGCRVRAETQDAPAMSYLSSTQLRRYAVSDLPARRGWVPRLLDSTIDRPLVLRRRDGR